MDNAPEHDHGQSDLVKAGLAPALSWPLIGTSMIHKEMLYIAKVYAPLFEPVYLYGQPGTGKQTLARSMHYLAHATEQGFQVIDCAQNTPFNIQSTNQTTKSLYLRNIEHLSITQQAAIFDFVVNSAPHKAPRIFLGSQSLSLQEATMHPGFKLYLLQYPIELPPLHKRTEDIPSLASFYTAKYQATGGLPDEREWSLSTTWPENIRTLQKRCTLREQILTTKKR